MKYFSMLLALSLYISACANAIASPVPSPTEVHIQSETPTPIFQEATTVENVPQIVKLARWGNGFPRQAVYSPNGEFIVLGTSIGIRVYRSDTLELIRFIETPSNIGSVAISPDGAIIAAGGQDLLLIYKASDGTLLKTMEKGIKDLDFSPDGRFLAVGIGDWNLCRGGEIELWSTTDWTLNQNLASGLECVGKVLFSPSGKYLAATSHEVLVWEFNNNDVVLKRRDQGCAEQEHSLAFTLDESFLLMGSSRIVCLDRVSDGEHLGVLKRGKPENYFSSPQISLLPNRDLIAIIQDNTLTLWSPNEWKVVQIIENVSNAIWSPDGNDIFSISGGDLKVWRIGDDKSIYSKDLFSEPTTAISWSSDPDFLAIATSSNQTNLITLKDKQAKKPDSYINIDAPIFSFVFPSSGKKLGFGFDERGTQIWDLDNNKLIQTFDGVLGYGRRSAEFSEDGSMLVLNIEKKPYESDTQNLEVWATDDWSMKFSWKVKEPAVILTDIDVSTDNKYVAASFYKGKVRLWDLESGLLDANLIFPNDSELMMGVAFSPNGKYIASASLGGKLGVWSTDTHQLLYTFETQGTWQEQTSGDSIAWSPNGQLLAIGARNGKIFLINAENGNLVYTLKGQTEDIYEILFSSDGNMLISASEDGTICLWAIVP